MKIKNTNPFLLESNFTLNNKIIYLGLKDLFVPSSNISHRDKHRGSSEKKKQKKNKKKKQKKKQ